MPRDCFELECNGELVTLEYTAAGELLFHGWDLELELAAIELGFAPTVCYWVWKAVSQNQLDATLAVVAFDDNLPLVEALLWAGANPYHKHTLALRRAKKFRQPQTVALLETRMRHG